MNWTEQRHMGERLLEWGAPGVLAAAAGWAAFAVSGAAVTGFGVIAAVFGLGVLAMARADTAGRAPAMSDFAVEPVDVAAHSEVGDGELLLDDPLREVAADSRVVAMFEPEIETPGAMVARIADYLGERGPDAQGGSAAIVAADAGAALHEALANIRASLR